jgi:hypothetical protein
MRPLAISALLLCLFAASAEAKRGAPAKVTPVVAEGVRYSAPNDSGRTATVVAEDAASGKVLWSVVVFRTAIDPKLEEDVQWVYVTGLEVVAGDLVVTDEHDRRWAVSPTTRKARALPKP